MINMGDLQGQDEKQSQNSFLEFIPKAKLKILSSLHVPKLGKLHGGSYFL